MTRVKICGLMDPVNAMAAAWAGADFVGMILAPGRRRIDEYLARTITEVVHGMAPAGPGPGNGARRWPSVLGVFADAPIDEVNRIAGYCRFDYVQLSGTEDWAYVRDVGYPVLKVIKVRPGQTAADVVAEIEAGFRRPPAAGLTITVEAHHPEQYGGTGVALDWALAREVAAQHPIMLAGGLTPENVVQAIETVAPWGVDVSSGVESDEMKDSVKITRFVQEVRRTDRERGRTS